MSKNIVYFTFIIVCLIIRQIYTSYLQVSFNSYLLLFGLLYIITYYLTKKTNLSLFIGLIVIMGRTIYRYTFIHSVDNLHIQNTILFIFGISLPFLVSNYKKYFNNNYINGINFVGLVYIMISYTEYIMHKYIMHCDKDSKSTKLIKKIPYLGNEFIDTCEHHIQHHLDVEKDMHIDEPSFEAALYMGWDIMIYLFPITIAIMTINKYITNFNISYRMIVLVSFVLCFIWQYIWNKVHVKMHNIENNYSIKKGPYDQGLFDLNLVTRVLFTNHANHHIQKGYKKGNYNIIFLGADEWLYSNNKTPDNTEYCKTNKTDKVCQ